MKDAMDIHMCADDMHAGLFAAWYHVFVQRDGSKPADQSDPRPFIA
ncbi:MAG: hypothetical protein ACYCZE_00440 [Thiobacillus sp.]